MKRIVIFFALWLIFSPKTGFCNQDNTSDNLTELSLEELMNVEVTLAAKKPQKLSQTAAAVFVITGEDIRRLGCTSIPDALRMVPGLQVAKIDSSRWAITSRGFNGRYAYKLLVLMDGRTIYSSVFSGVFWDAQDTLMEDIDRIEVIRGPGASLWGANAVNGIINIITKNSDKTQGGLAFTGAGTEEKIFGGARYGDKIGEDTTYRIYAKYFDKDDASDSNGNGKSDAWNMFSSGFRTDKKTASGNEFTLQGDIHQGERENNLFYPTLTPPYTELYDQDDDITGLNILGKWRHPFSERSDMILQIYYDRTEMEESTVSWDGDIIDIDCQHKFTLGNRQEIIWGLGYRMNHDDIQSSSSIALEPDQTYNLFTGFIQDEISVIPELVRLTLGSRFEHNDYTGFEFQPNARILWTPHVSHTFWTAVSRAVRTPSRINNDLKYLVTVIPPYTEENPSSFPATVKLIGNKDMESESLISFEAGYRLHPEEALSFDMTAFYTLGDNLLTLSPGTAFFEDSSMSMVIPYNMGNYMSGETWGLEFTANWQLSDRLRTQLSYTYLDMDLHPEISGLMDTAVTSEGWSPEHQVSFRSSADLPYNMKWDILIRYVDDILDGGVGSYTELDTRLGWNIMKNLEISVVGKNLLESQHPEFKDMFLRGIQAEVERSVYGKITWQF